MEAFLKQLNLDKAKVGPYDPHNVISNQILAKKNSQYDCVPILDWENIENKENWEVLVFQH